MIKTIIYSVTLGTIILSSGAIATPVTNATFTPESSHVLSDTGYIAASIDTAALEQSVFNQINNF